MSKVKVTVIIPTYNKAPFIKRAIQSVQKQTLKEWDMVIVDDASTDHTYKIVRKIIRNDPRIHYIRLEKNRGISGVWRTVLPLITTKYFIQLDGDDWLNNKALKILLKAMEKSKGKAAVAYSNLVRRTQDKKGRVVKKRKVKHRKISGKYDFITYHNMIYPRFYRTDCVREVGGWSTNVPYNGRYSEDRQILLKLAPKYPFIHVKQFLYNHRIHGRNNSGKKNLDKYAKVNRYLYTTALKEWGNKYKPVFMWKKGRIKVKKLKKRH